MMKLGVVYFRPILERCGGPGTYLFNLKKSYEMIAGDNDNLIFMGIEGKKISSLKRKLIIIINIIMVAQIRFLLKKDSKWREFLFQCWERIQILYEEENYRMIYKDVTIDTSCEAYHFHSWDDLVYCKEYYENINGKLILTLHSPQKIDDEIVDIYKDHFKTEYDFVIIRKHIDWMVKKAFTMADAYVYPCQECYLLYQELGYITDTLKPVGYLATGTYFDEKIDQQIKTNIRDENKIHSKVIGLFCGRHNEIKGYDLLIKAFEGLENVDIEIIGAGIINEKIVPPTSDRWHELGWRDDVGRIMEESDIVFVIGRSVYYDLIALEAMAHKCIIIASDTGGNKSLARLSKGVFLFESENIQALEKVIKEVVNMSCSEMDYYKMENYNAYKQNASPNVFAKNYLNCIKQLLGRM